MRGHAKVDIKFWTAKTVQHDHDKKNATTLQQQFGMRVLHRKVIQPHKKNPDSTRQAHLLAERSAGLEEPHARHWPDKHKEMQGKFVQKRIYFNTQECMHIWKEYTEGTSCKIAHTGSHVTWQTHICSIHGLLFSMLKTHENTGEHKAKFAKSRSASLMNNWWYLVVANIICLSKLEPCWQKYISKPPTTSLGMSGLTNKTVIDELHVIFCLLLIQNHVILHEGCGPVKTN